MKTKFKVEIFKFGCHSQFLLEIIANHNEGKCNIDLDIMCGYMVAKKAQYPALSDGKLFIKSEVDNTIYVSDDGGETYYLGITECEIYELETEFLTP